MRHSLTRNLFLLVALVFLISYSYGKSSDNQSPDQKGDAGVSATEAPSSIGTEQYSVEIAPADATRRSTLFLLSKGFDLSEAKIEWLVDGIPAGGANAFTFNASQTKKGDVVCARVTAKGREMRSNDVTIKNCQPEITRANFLASGNTLSVDAAANDADGDDVTLAYEWTVNGKPAGSGKTIEIQVKKEDKITVKIVPSDGTSQGRPVFLTNEISNMAPVISENAKFNFDGNKWSYQIMASDPDGNALTYSLKSAPSGMTVNPATGLITWNVPSEFGGRASVTASVSDGHGGEASHIVNIEIAR